MIDAPQDRSGMAGFGAGAGAAAELAAARERLEQALDRWTTDEFDTAGPADTPDPAAAAYAASTGYVACAEEAGVLSPRDGAALVAPLADRLRTAETAVEARHRAERAIEWALLAARRRVGREGRYEP